MANPMERPGKAEWWMWAMGLALVAGLAWLIVSMADDDKTVVDQGVVRTEEARPIEDPESEYVPVEVMVASPADYRDQGVSGMVVVTRVVSPRSFFVRGEEDELIFATQDPKSIQTPVQLQPGQRIEIAAMVHGISEIDTVMPERLKPEDHAAAMRQPVFLHVSRVGKTVEGEAARG